MPEVCKTPWRDASLDPPFNEDRVCPYCRSRFRIRPTDPKGVDWGEVQMHDAHGPYRVLWINCPNGRCRRHVEFETYPGDPVEHAVVRRPHNPR